jgi:hypothetical protein
MSPPADIDSLSASELKALLLALYERVFELNRTVNEQRERSRG